MFCGLFSVWGDLVVAEEVVDGGDGCLFGGVGGQDEFVVGFAGGGGGALAGDGEGSRFSAGAEYWAGSGESSSSGEGVVRVFEDEN